MHFDFPTKFSFSVMEEKRKLALTMKMTRLKVMYLHYSDLKNY